MGDHMSRNNWFIRAGENAYLFDEFKLGQAIAIGWNEVGSLEQVKHINDVKRKLRTEYPDYKDGKINITAGQLFRFAHEMKIGDLVVTYNPQAREYLIGDIVSEYQYGEGHISDKTHYRKVTWNGSVGRDVLTANTRNSLGSIMTLFALQQETVKELVHFLKHKNNKPLEPQPEEIEEEQAELNTIKEDVIERAHEFIKDKFNHLDWEEMQSLVAGVLRGMGYKTRISVKGPDRGRDIVASPDGLGLQQPRIMVEVKHRKNSMGSNEIRSFIGGLRPGDQGIYVSTGGFTREAHYEAERSNIPISLVDADLLVELINQHYDKFDSEAQSLMPLKKIYWPL
jgi:restriction system protein